MEQMYENKQLFAVWKRQHPKTKALCYLSVGTAKMKHNFASFLVLCHSLSACLKKKKLVSAHELNAFCKYPMYHAKQLCIDKTVLGFVGARLRIWKKGAKMQAPK